jgi:type II secretory pathway pseudopilin PulG
MLVISIVSIAVVAAVINFQPQVKKAGKDLAENHATGLTDAPAE